MVEKLNDRFTLVDASKAVEEYIGGTDWRIKANANTSYSNAGLINNSAGKLIANYWLDNVYSKEEGDAHRNGDFHIHDLDILGPYCCGHDLAKLLREGFNGVRGRISARPPKHFDSALDQMVNYIGILQAEWAGAQAFSSYDTYLAPYVFYDTCMYGRTYKDIKDATLSFIYGLNVPNRWGQSPFSNITIDWKVPNDLKEQWPMYNDIPFFEKVYKDFSENDKQTPGYIFLMLAVRNRLSEEEAKTAIEFKDDDEPEDLALLKALRYKHFQKEMDLINKAFYECLIEGDINGLQFTFPIPTVNITEDFDWDDPNTELLFIDTAKYGHSYFQNFCGSQYLRDENGELTVKDENAYNPNDVRSMCCRLRLDKTQIRKKGGGLFGSDSQTGSVGVVTINAARLGYLNKGNKENLYAELKRLMDLAVSSLNKKRVFVQELLDRGLYPYTKRYLNTLDTFFSTIGILGVNEMIRNFTDDEHDITDEYGQKFAKDILDFMNKNILEYQQKYDILYNLEASPGEGTTYRFGKEDLKRYPDIIHAGTENAPYYTNSTQLPVGFTDDAFKALDLQDELQTRYSGGTVIHLYMAEAIESPETCKNLVKTVLTNYRLPYISVTPTFSSCPIHGYISGAHEFCPYCDQEILKGHSNELTLGSGCATC